jgi:dihydrofolate reductase
VSIRREDITMSVIVIALTTVDGIVSDPDGRAGTPGGGWAFRHGPEAVDWDKFRLGASLDDGVMLLGRTTWELFSRLWPGREGPFAERMNAAAKLVATRTLTDVSAWRNSSVLDGDLVDEVKKEQRDVVVTGSPSVARALIAEDVVDEYRLLTFPTVLGTGVPLFPAGGPPMHLECVSADQEGPAVLTCYRRAGDGA